MSIILTPSADGEHTHVRIPDRVRKHVRHQQRFSRCHRGGCYRLVLLIADHGRHSRYIRGARDNPRCKVSCYPGRFDINTVGLTGGYDRGLRVDCYKVYLTSSKTIKYFITSDINNNAFITQPSTSEFRLDGTKIIGENEASC